MLNKEKTTKVLLKYPVDFKKTCPCGPYVGMTIIDIEIQIKIPNLENLRLMLSKRYPQVGDFRKQLYGYLRILMLKLATQRDQAERARVAGEKRTVCCYTLTSFKKMTEAHWNQLLFRVSREEVLGEDSIPFDISLMRKEDKDKYLKMRAVDHLAIKTLQKQFEFYSQTDPSYDNMSPTTPSQEESSSIPVVQQEILEILKQQKEAYKRLTPLLYADGDSLPSLVEDV